MSVNNNTTGRAVIVLRDQRAYEGATSIAADWVHLGSDGRLRVPTAKGITYRSTGSRSWPTQRILEVRWLERDREAA